MKRKLYRVSATMVERLTTEYRVFAESPSEAEQRVQRGQGERLKRRRQTVEQASFRARLDKGAES